MSSGPSPSTYAAALGLEIADAHPEHARLHLPFRETNANPGGALHGGCAASLAAAGAHAVTREALGPDAGPFVTASLQVTYLAAAIREDVDAEARLLRRGKELCFVEVAVTAASGRPIARALAGVAANAAGTEPLPASVGDDGAAEPGPMGPHVEKLGFIARRGIRIEHMAGGRSRLRMPANTANVDDEGRVHEGAALALLDTTGAMAAWAETGPGPYKASTPAIQAQVLAPLPAAELVAFGRCVHRRRELLWSDVEVADAARGHVVARGTVLYRITP